MSLADGFFLIALLSQCIIVWLLTADIWFPKYRPIPAALLQGAITFLIASVAGSVLNGLLYFLVIAFPVLVSWVVSDTPLASELKTSSIVVRWLVALIPLFLLVGRLFAQVKRRLATQAWQSSRNSDRL